MKEKNQRILVACEFSGRVRDAFIARGHNAVSCDIVASDAPGPHIQGCALAAMQIAEWDMIIAFPPCTRLCSSGARWWKDYRAEQEQAIGFARAFIEFNGRVAVENPIGILSTVIRPPDQIIQPWMFGHGETKSTCLWLNGLPKLTPTNIVEGRESRIHRMPASKNRSKLRSVTYAGIAEAMAQQWG